MSWWQAILGPIAGGFGAASENKSNQWQLEQEAATAEKNAVLARQAGEFNAYRQGIIAKQKIGGMEADYGASGVTSDSGSVLDVLRQSHINAELDRQSILYGAEIEASDSTNRAAMARVGGRNLERNKYLSVFNSMFGSGKDALSRMGGSGNGKISDSYSPQNNGQEFRDGNLRADSRDFSNYV